MKVAVWYDPRYGPALVATLPKGSEMPEFASIPEQLPPGIRQQFLNKGSELDWTAWAEHLEERLPYHGQWEIEEVEDGIPLHEALSRVRKRAADRAFTGQQAKPLDKGQE